MQPDSYRLYRLDGAGLIHDAEWFDALDDTDAVALVASKHPDAMCEIWNNKRLVASLQARRYSA